MRLVICKRQILKEGKYSRGSELCLRGPAYRAESASGCKLGPSVASESLCHTEPVISLF